MHVGVDGCRAGWFGVAIDQDGGWSVAVDTTVVELWARWRNAHAILVDMPIGLRDGGAERECDRAARRLLGARRSSVFPAPCRVALAGTSFVEASELNRLASGRSLSQQTWWILHKIRELDELLLSEEAARPVIREVHPEVLFWALNDGQAMSHAKKRLQGFRERLAVLERHFPKAPVLIEDARRAYGRAAVARDDIVDALAAAVTGAGSYRSIPEDVEIDALGLRMEIVY